MLSELPLLGSFVPDRTILPLATTCHKNNNFRSILSFGGTADAEKTWFAICFSVLN